MIVCWVFHFSFLRECVCFLTPWWAEVRTERITETRSLFFVNFLVLIPNRPLSCWRAMVMAAPPINPTIAAWDKKSIKKPNLNKKTQQKKFNLYIYIITQDSRFDMGPEKSKNELSNTGKKSGSKSKTLIIVLLFDGIKLLLKQSSEQEWHHCHWSNGDISWTTHECIHQWWNKATIYTPQKKIYKKKQSHVKIWFLNKQTRKLTKSILRI